MNTKTKLILCTAASTALLAPQAFSAVTITTVAAANTVDFGTTQNLGTRVVDTQPALAAGGFSTEGQRAVQQTFSVPSSGKLAAYGIHMTGSGAGTYSVTLKDFGTTGPVVAPGVAVAQFDYAGAVVLFTDSFSLEASTTAAQVYFNFSGASTVNLDSTHYYGFLVDFNAAGANVISRGPDVYPGGNIAVGTPGSLTYTGANAPRDQSIAVYTTPIPEPASAGLLGLGVLLGTFGVRRRN